MDYEKKYNEALERARKAYNAIKPENDGARKIIENAFPELRESEDERVRKWLIQYIKDTHPIANYWNGAPTISDVLSWLEKQKEQKPAECIEDSVKFEEGFKTGRESGLRDGQKYVLDNAEAYGLCKHAKWSEEDEKMIDTIVSVLGQYIDYKAVSGTGSGYATPRYSKEIAWLKSLRPQPQGTYKLIVHNIYEMLKDKDFFDIPPSHRVSLLNDIRVRCKNADEQAEILDVPSWKPSEWQMSMLLAVINDPSNAGSESCHLALTSLYNYLKKLM